VRCSLEWRWWNVFRRRPAGGGDRRVENPQRAQEIRAGQPPGGQAAAATVGGEHSVILCSAGDQQSPMVMARAWSCLTCLSGAEHFQQPRGKRHGWFNLAVEEGELGSPGPEASLGVGRRADQDERPWLLVHWKAHPPAKRPARPLPFPFASWVNGSNATHPVLRCPGQRRQSTSWPKPPAACHTAAGRGANGCLTLIRDQRRRGWRPSAPPPVRAAGSRFARREPSSGS
jgi:hypothetical protein